ncbi:MAG: MarR family winged helix-turn-helix transcriptional regulator [Mycobacteriales bacterium]
MSERGLVSTAPDVEDLVELSRLLVSVAYRSLAAAGSPVALPQFRALAVLARLGPMTAGTLAEALDTHPSTVTRLGDRLVAAGWVSRRNRPENRREVELDLTDAGRALVEEVLTARAAELEEILGRLPVRSRTALARLLPQLLEAADSTVTGARQAWAV